MGVPYRYAEKLRREDAHVYLLDCPTSRRSVLANSLLATSERFGFTFSANIGTRPADRAGLLHGIMVVDQPATADFVEKAAMHLRNGLGSISVAFTYPKLEMLNSSAMAIEHFKQQYGDNINFLRPDSQADGAYFVSDQKILDNAVCDTVRVKYTPRRRRDTCRELLDEESARYFQQAYEAYARFRLYHRSPTDGYVALRKGDGFLITATKTSKLMWDPERISFVHGFDEDSNIIEFSGSFLPSSDSVEAAIIYKKIPSIRTLVHTHASDRFTRNPKFAKFIEVPRLPYGEPELGRSIAAAIANRGSGMTIMDDHGEVFFSEYEAGALAKIDELCLMSPAYTS